MLPTWCIRWGQFGKEELLAQAYKNSFQLALKNGAKTIAFPSISTGVYGFPIEKATAIALKTVRDFVERHSQFTEIRFILFSEADLQVYQQVQGSMEQNR